jgi:hypothetical protein
MEGIATVDRVAAIGAPPAPLVGAPGKLGA